MGNLFASAWDEQHDIDGCRRVEDVSTSSMLRYTFLPSIALSSSSMLLQCSFMTVNRTPTNIIGTVIHDYDRQSLALLIPACRPLWSLDRHFGFGTKLLSRLASTLFPNRPHGL